MLRPPDEHPRPTPIHHWLARPLPEPVRSRHRSRIAQPPRDRLGRLLEEWLADVRIRYTYPGE